MVVHKPADQPSAEHVDPHRQHAGRPRGSDPLQDHPGFASPHGRQQPEKALDEDGRVKRDQEHRENVTSRATMMPATVTADRLDRQAGL